jgi:hypothetical protein
MNDAWWEYIFCVYLAVAVLEPEELHRLLRAVDGDDCTKIEAAVRF